MEWTRKSSSFSAGLSRGWKDVRRWLAALLEVGWRKVPSRQGDSIYKGPEARKSLVKSRNGKKARIY